MYYVNLPWKDRIQDLGKDKLSVDSIQCPECNTHIEGHGEGQCRQQPVLELAYSGRALWHQLVRAHKIIDQRYNVIQSLNYL